MEAVMAVSLSRRGFGGVGFFVLFRRALENDTYRVFIAVNDTWPGDRDTQDSLYLAGDIHMPPVVINPGCVNCETPSVPEPASVLLFGMCALGIARLFRRR